MTSRVYERQQLTRILEPLRILEDGAKYTGLGPILVCDDMNRPIVKMKNPMDGNFELLTVVLDGLWGKCFI